MEITFIDYKKTPSEKYLGIATVNFNNLVYLRYKIVQGKDGNGYFVAPASYKIDDYYVPCFVVDSNMTKERINTVIRKGVDDFNNGTSQSVYSNPSAFSSQNTDDMNVPF